MTPPLPKAEQLPTVPWYQSAWTLEKWRWRQGWSALARAKRGDRLRRWFGLTFRILWPLGSLLIFRAALLGLEEPELGHYVLAMVTLFTFLILLVAAIKFAYQTFFSAPDLELLQGLPLAPRGIFVAKYMDNLAFSNQLVALFAVGPWVGYGLAMEWPLLRILGAIAGIFFLPVYTTALGIAVSLLVSRFVAKARLRETLMLGSMGISVFFYLAMRQAIEVDVDVAARPDAAMFLWSWLPTTWLVSWAIDPLAEVAKTALLQYYFLGMTLFVLAAWLGDAAYHWGLTHLEKDAGRAGSGAPPKVLQLFGSVSPSRAIWFKDLLTFSRDPRQWYYLIFFAVLFFAPGGGGVGDKPEKVPILFQTLRNTFFLVFMATMALQELTVLGVSREGPKRWLLQALPFSPGAILWGKYSVVFVFTVVLATLGGLCEVAIGELSWQQFPATLTGSVIIAGTINWAFLSLGARWPDFEGYHQRHRVSPVLALAIAIVDGLVLAVLFVSATVLGNFEFLAEFLKPLKEVPYEVMLWLVTGLMAVTLLGLFAAGLWNGYSAVRNLLQEK